jgi:lysophospholipase L1-like esterase
LLAGKTLALVPPEEWNRELVDNILRQADQDMSVPAGQVVLIGDSIMAQLDPGLIGAGVINFGIGGDTTRTLHARLPIIRSVFQSRAVAMEIGVNDLKYRSVDEFAHDYAAVLDRLTAPRHVFALSVLPVDENGPAARQRPYLRNERIAAMNKELKRVCEAHANCRYVDARPVVAENSAYGADGWHLSEIGNRRLADLIRHALAAAD